MLTTLLSSHCQLWWTGFYVSFIPLGRYITRNKKQSTTQGEAWFGELISLNVDHQFQSCSSEMSLETSNIAYRLGIPHETLRIPWGFPPYAVKPSPGQPIEHIARDARYTLLLSRMRQHDADVIAFGHHADDQLETFLMRLANGTGHLGLGGMKPVRRFGMGDWSPGQMGWYEIDWMQRWVVRPLLSVPKVGYSSRPQRLRPHRIGRLWRVMSAGWTT